MAPDHLLPTAACLICGLSALKVAEAPSLLLYFFLVCHLCSSEFYSYDCIVTANKNYSCEGLGLTEIPETLPAVTENLDFSFNLLSSLQNTTFNMLKYLEYLDLTGTPGSNLHLPQGITS
uniref:Uncharacterized protein n=1 Tax=Crocodylus porosus TaxID=8502 RepID=A0A7M4FM65_CROPO